MVNKVHTIVIHKIVSYSKKGVVNYMDLANRLTAPQSSSAAGETDDNVLALAEGTK